MMGLVCVALKFETSRAQERSLCFKAKSHMIYCLMLHCDQAAPPPPSYTQKGPNAIADIWWCLFSIEACVFFLFFFPNDSEGLAERLF